MSNTVKDKIRGKYKRNSKKYNAWYKLKEIEKKIIINYSKSPSWFNRMHHRKPQRRMDNKLLQIIKRKQSFYNDEYKFSINRKPTKYYW